MEEIPSEGSYSDNESQEAFMALNSEINHNQKDVLLAKCREVIEGLHKEIDEREVSLMFIIWIGGSRGFDDGKWFSVGLTSKQQMESVRSEFERKKNDNLRMSTEIGMLREKERELAMTKSLSEKL